MKQSRILATISVIAVAIVITVLAFRVLRKPEPADSWHKNPMGARYIQVSDAGVAREPEVRENSGGGIVLPKPNSSSPLERGETVRTEALADRGKATPRATFETLYWALAGGDITKIADSLFLGREAQSEADQLFASLSKEKRREFGTAPNLVASMLVSVSRNAALQITGDEPGAKFYPAGLGLPDAATDDPAFHTVRTTVMLAPDGKESSATMVFHLAPDGWRWVMPPSMIDFFGKKLRSPIPPSSKR